MTGRKSFRPGEKRIAVIDIGSNSVRLVVFDGLTRIPIPLFNEKIFAALGKTVGSTGRLNPEGVTQAFETLARFSRLLKAMKVSSCHVVATAAVRDAEDSVEFLAQVKKRAGLNVRIISGEEEGRLSAMGVLSAIPDADGAMGDMGGGSVELVRLDKGEVKTRATMPFGPFRLMAMGGGKSAQTAAIDARLEELPWLAKITGKDFYAVGGIWRAFAMVHMEQIGHPLHIVHHHAIDGAEAMDFAQLLSRQSRLSLEGSSVAKRRLESLPYASMFLERLFRLTKPKRLVFSAFGLREGILYDLLTPKARRADPLLAACMAAADRLGRFGEAKPLVDWILPHCLETPEAGRLCLTACLLSDIGWLEHPDHRAEQAYLRTLRMPFGGIDHPGRAFLALSLYLRYGGRVDDPATAPSHVLLDEKGLREATGLGLLLRLAYTLCGGALSLLGRTLLVREEKRLVLKIAPNSADLNVDAVDKRLEALAKYWGLGYATEITPVS